MKHLLASNQLLVRYLAMALLLIAAALLTACNDKDSGDYKPKGVVQLQSSYIVGIHPYLNSKKTYLSYRPILDYLEANIAGVKFELQTASNYADYEEKLYKTKFDFALPNPYQTVNAISMGYTVIAKMKPDDVFRGVIVARKSSNIQSVNDLKGKTVSFPAKTALAAAMMPLYFLHKNGLDVNKDIELKFVGSQFSSIMNAYTGDSIAAATWPPPWEQWKKENPDMATEMIILWVTQPLTNNGFVAKDTIDNNLSLQVAKALVELSSTEKGKTILQNAGFDGFEYADNAKYEPVKKFLKEYDKAIGLPK